MIERKLRAFAAAAAALLLTGVATVSSAAEQSRPADDPKQKATAPSRPSSDSHCEHLTGADRTNCERRMRERMSNTDRTRMSRKDAEGCSRRGRSISGTADDSDTLGRQSPAQADEADAASSQDSTDTTTSTSSPDQDADTLNRDRGENDSAVDTTSPR